MRFGKFLLISCLMTSLVYAGQRPILGGTLQTSDGHKVFTQCSEQNSATGECQQINILIQKPNKYPETVVYNFLLSCRKLGIKNLSKHYRHQLNDIYGDKYLFLANSAEKACLARGNGYSSCIAGVTFGAILSLPFAPIVMLGQAGVNIGTLNKKSKLEKLFNFMTDENQRGTKTISKIEYSTFETLTDHALTGYRYDNFYRCIQQDAPL